MSLSAERYERPGFRARTADPELVPVVVVHDSRFVAPALAVTLRGRAEVIGDAATGAAALALADLTARAVVVAGELLADGPLDHFLAALRSRSATVVVLVDVLTPRRAADLVGLGVDAVCLTSAPLGELAAAVLEVAAGGAVLSPPVAAEVVGRWRRQGGSIEGAAEAARQRLSERERQVYDAMLEGLATKAIARRLGVSLKTAEAHKSRVFAKLGVRSQTQLVGLVGARQVIDLDERPDAQDEQEETIDVRSAGVLT